MYESDRKGKKSLGARIEDELMKYILNEPVGQGQRIPNEFELAERFGVGRSTIREAVKGLVSRGILQRLRNLCHQRQFPGGGSPGAEPDRGQVQGGPGPVRGTPDDRARNCCLGL